jgi:hypothetical protein
MNINLDEFLKNHRGHRAHRDNWLIKQNILCVLCELSGKK